MIASVRSAPSQTGIETHDDTARHKLYQAEFAKLSSELRMAALTQLRLELALAHDAPELGQVTAILRSDPVAVLLLFELFEGVHTSSEEVPRLEDMVALLGKSELLQSLCRHAPALGPESDVSFALTQHAFVLATMCRTLAEATGLPGELAFLTGLLHDVVGPREQDEDADLTGTNCDLICTRYHLPPTLRLALLGVARQDTSSPWTAVVRAAQELLARTQVAR